MEYSLLRDWREGQGLITLARNPAAPGATGDVAAYCHFEALAVKWGAAPHAATPTP